MILTITIIRIIGYSIGLIGMWIFSDGAYSIALYLNTPSFRSGEKQSWKKDHAIRLVRSLLGIGLMLAGGMLVVGSIN